MHALGVAADLLADDASRVTVRLGAANAASEAQHLDVERADRWTVVRAGGVADLGLLGP